MTHSMVRSPASHEITFRHNDMAELLQNYLHMLRGIGGGAADSSIQNVDAVAYKSFFAGINAYAGSARSFHNPGHRDEMSLGLYAELIEALYQPEMAPSSGAPLSEDEIRNVAAAAGAGGFHHDDVYLQVDGGVATSIQGILNNYVTFGTTHQFQAIIRNDLPPVGQLVCDVFGFKPGDVISLNTPSGLNEFLSALVWADFAEKMVGSTSDAGSAGRYLNCRRKIEQAIVGSLAIIEATIPFRSADAFEALYTRLTEVVGLDERIAEIYTKAAVLAANRDVNPFCGGGIEEQTSLAERFQYFISGTWRLMPESNVALRGQDYTPAAFLTALRGNHGFLTQAPVTAPEKVFHQFRGYPSQEVLQTMRERWGDEIRPLVADYLQAKIASASIVATVAAIHQPEGDKTSLVKFVSGVADRLPELEHKASDGHDAVVYNALRDRGGDAPNGWDTRRSPIAVYLMEKVGKQGVREIYQLQAEHLKSDHMNYEALWTRLREKYPEVLKGITAALIAANEATAESAIQASRGADRRIGGLYALRLD